MKIEVVKGLILFGVVAAVVVIAVVLVLRNSSQPQVPAGWSEVEVGPRLSFWVPPTFMAAPGRPVDSLAGELTGEGCTMRYDFGSAADPLDSYSHYSNYTEQQVRIDGKPGKQISFTDEANNEHVAAIHFDQLARGKKLTVYIGCNSVEKVRELEAILYSIRFR